MARDETPPFPRGNTYFQGGTVDAVGGYNLLGKEWRHEDTTYGTNQYVTIRAVRNTGAFALLPGRVVAFDSAGVPPLGTVNGYATTTAAPGCVLDEFLPSAGLLANDVGYIVVEGPCKALTDLAGGANNPISFLDPLVALTAATSGSTTAGRVYTDLTGAVTTGTRDQLLNILGRAMAAATTANTNYGILMFAERWF